jgi:ERCC4-type nuclease
MPARHDQATETLPYGSPPMVRVDSRAGSKELIKPLQRAHIPVEETILSAGDVEILGCGPEGRVIPVGVEYKTIEDAATCVRSGRFAEQLRDMHGTYEVYWLLVEGRYRQHRHLEVWNGRRWFELPGKLSEAEFNGWLLTMCQRGGALLWHTEDIDQTVRWIKSQINWWIGKDYEEHRAIRQIYTPPLETENPFESPTLAHRTARVWPGLGDLKAERAAKHFHTVEKMVNAEPKEWQEVEGVGKGISEALFEALRKEA